MELELSPARRKPGRQPRAATAKGTTDTPTEVDLGFEIDTNKVYLFETIKKSQVPRTENLGSRYKAFDDVEKRYRDIGYYPTAPSIFVEEWHESVQDMPQPPLSFWRDQITVDGKDLRLMEYMMYHPLCESSPCRVMNKPAMYALADKEVLERMKAKTHATEMKALKAIEDTPIDDLRPIARVIFGITETSDTALVNAMNDFVKKGKKVGEQKSNADKVLDNINNPELLRKYNIQAAIDKGVIMVDMNKMRVTFSDGVPVYTLTTKNPVKELVEYSYDNDGKKFYELMRAKL